MTGDITANQARKRLYEVMKQDTSFEQKAQSVLELGETYLDVENGHVTRIDPEADYWEAIASTDPPDGEFPPGQLLDFETTYCRRTIASDSPIALHDAPNQGWEDDVAFEEHGLHCYHGTTLTVDGDPYGTVCFVSEEPRDTPFSDEDTLFAELIARLLEHELEHNRHQAELTQRANTITVLSRVLRHNLRNDMAVIRGNINRLRDQVPEADQTIDTIVKKVDELLELSETARMLESTVSTKFDRQTTDLNTVINRAISRVKPRYSSASFTVEGPEDVAVVAMPSLSTAVEELIENAAKHARNPDVTVSIEPSSDFVDVHVTDNGPGLPEQEQQVLNEETEMPLAHGSGLGLWLVYEIVSAHDGVLDTEVSDDGTQMTMTLPREKEVDHDMPLQRWLQREHDRFEAVFEHAFEGILILDDEAQILDANTAAAELYGAEPEDLLGRLLEEFLPPGFDSEAEWESFVADGHTRGTVTIHRADGSERVVEYAAIAEILPGQHLTVMRDVTERKERRQELEATTERLEAIFEACPNPLLVIDRDGAVERWNSAAEATFGWSEAEVLGDRPPLIPSDEEELFAKRMEQIREGERFIELELERETKDGDMIDVSLSTAPIRDTDGTVAGTVAIAEDISDRIARERELTEMSHQLEGVLDTAPAAVFMKDTEGQYLLMNKHARQLAGLGAETSVTGKTDYDLFPEDVATQFRADDEFVCETGEEIKRMEVVPSPEGPKRHLTIKRPVFEESGEMYGICAVSMDISDFENIAHTGSKEGSPGAETR